MGQAPFIFSDAPAVYLNAVKNAITAVHLVRNFKHIDTRNSVVSVKSMANIAISGADMAITVIDGDDALVINPKSDLDKTSDSVLHFLGDATGGSRNVITKLGEAWDNYTDKVVHIVSGSGIGQTGKITGVYEDDLQFSESFKVAIDSTSRFEIRDDVWTVYVSDSAVVYAVNETTDKAIASASADQVNISGTTISLPKLANKV